MNWHLSPYTIGLALTTLLSLTAAYTAFQHRHRPGGLALAFTMLAIAEWAGCYVFEANAVTLPLKVLWSQIAYVGTFAAAPCLLNFARGLTRPGRKMGRTLAFAIWSIPVVTVVLAFTNGAHHLVWSGFTFADASHRVLIYERGRWYYVMVVHTYALLTATAALLFRAAFRYRAVYRQQSLLILVSLLPPWGINIIYVALPSVLGRQDWTPTAFAITGAMLLWSFDGLQLLELLPVARDRVIEKLEDGVMVVDAQGRIVDLNPAVLRLLDSGSAAAPRFRDRDTIGRRAVDLFPVLDTTPLARWDPSPAVVGALAEEPQTGEVTIDGRTLTWRLIPLPEPLRDRPAHLVQLQDITQRRKAHMALQEANAGLELRVAERIAEIRSEKERGDAILRSVSDGIVLTDRDRYVVYANPAFSDLTGYTADEALGCRLDEFLGSPVAPSVSTEAPALAWPEDLQVRRRDGRQIDAAATASPVRSEAGAVSGYVVTLRDVSQTRALDRARKGFLDNISHQLRTPVMTLQLYAHLMEQDDLTAENRSYLDAIDAQIAWLNHLIQDILEVTSLDTGKALSTWVPLGLATIADHLVTRYGRLAKAKGLSLVLSPLPAALPPVMGDSARLIQALSELVDNAIRFTPVPGTITLTVDRVQRQGQPWVTIAVADTGPGIASDEQGRIYDRFYRGGVAETLQDPGTGLGLPIAKTIVEAHGGEITLRCGDCPGGGGSIFTVWLPAALQHVV